MAAVNLIACEAVTLARGTRLVLDRVSAGVAAGERIGVVGRNGSGKSSLLAVLTGELPPDGGRVTRAGGLRVGSLTQHDTLDPAATVRQAVLGDRPEHVWAADARVRDVLAGLDLEARLDDPVGPQSGGQRRRIALAGLLVAQLLDGLDLLVLDEPTNHLDVQAVDRLARWLTGLSSALVVVTHDRWFLDAVTSRTWEVEAGSVAAFDGGYAAYVLARAERSRQQAASEQRRQNLLRKELAWLRRGPPARTSKPQFRIDAAQALIAGEPPPRDSLALRRFASARLGKDVVDVEQVSVSRGGRPVLREVTLRLGPGDRLGVLGVNGSGKTTLLRLLTGELGPDHGVVRQGKTVRPALLTQEVAIVAPADADADVAAGLPAGARVLGAVEEIARVIDVGKGRERSARQVLEEFGFAGDRLSTRVEDLSGGERRRLQLLRLLLGGPNLLLLDEPTNDLDVDTLAVLEDLLDGWPGTLVAVSHDRYLLERTCDTFIGVLDGALRDLPRGVDEFLELVERPAAAARPAPPAPPGGAGTPDAAAARAARKEIARLEKLLDRLATREAALHAQLAEHASDHQRVAGLAGELRALEAERAATEQAWLAAADVLD